ncbi:hypothetical protein LP420_26095 [Massilia sp. B-10]|nr:hypothetical protein LP420_26095 [Massilia sp. B-10]
MANYDHALLLFEQLQSLTEPAAAVPGAVPGAALSRGRRSRDPGPYAAGAGARRHSRPPGQPGR